jgi:hypothetical protein
LRRCEHVLPVSSSEGPAKIAGDRILIFEDSLVVREERQAIVGDLVLTLVYEVGSVDLGHAINMSAVDELGTAFAFVLLVSRQLVEIDVRIVTDFAAAAVISEIAAVDANFGILVDLDAMEINDYFEDVQVERR